MPNIPPENKESSFSALLFLVNLTVGPRTKEFLFS